MNEKRNLLEVIACSVEDAIAAARGGADRLELISNYEVGGLTPKLELVERVLAAVEIPVRVMLRDEESFFVTDEAAKERLCWTATLLAKLPIDGLVLGFLRDPGPEIDHELLARVLACSPGLKATFHRASESLPDPGRAIGELARHPQIDTLLTSGGPEPWGEKVPRLAEWQRRADPDRTILVGGGVYTDAIQLLRADSTIRAFHIGQAVRAGHTIEGAVETDRVRAIRGLV